MSRPAPARSAEGAEPGKTCTTIDVRVAAPGASSHAIGVVLGDGMLANVVGVPIGAFAGQIAGWRGPFWALAVLAALTALLILRFVPHDPGHARTASIRAEFAGLRSARLWLLLVGAGALIGTLLGGRLGDRHPTPPISPPQPSRRQSWWRSAFTPTRLYRQSYSSLFSASAG
jgi:predicted MFS family arabinose efflux permease